MRLVDLGEYKRMIFAPGSGPSLRTLRKHIEEIPGGCIVLGRYYVDMDEYDRRTNLRAGLDARERTILQGNPMLAELL